jgi:hypothetical protein
LRRVAAPVKSKPGQRAQGAKNCGPITDLSPVPIVEGNGEIILVRGQGRPESRQAYHRRAAGAIGLDRTGSHGIAPSSWQTRSCRQISGLEFRHRRSGQGFAGAARARTRAVARGKAGREPVTMICAAEIDAVPIAILVQAASELLIAAPEKS